MRSLDFADEGIDEMGQVGLMRFPALSEACSMSRDFFDDLVS